MKKIVALVLALMLALSMLTVATAETGQSRRRQEGSVYHAAALRHHLPDVEGFLRRPVRRAGC